MALTGRTAADAQVWSDCGTGHPVDLLPAGGNPRWAEVLRAGTDGRWCVSAATVRALVLTGRSPRAEVHAYGLCISGARIVGELDLRATTLVRPLRLERCVVDGLIRLDGATASQVSLAHSVLEAGLSARDATLAGLDLHEVRSGAGIVLAGARVSGSLDLSSARVTAPHDGDPCALRAHGIDIGGDLDLRHAVVAGEVVLAGARIGARLRATGASFTALPVTGPVRAGPALAVGRTAVDLRRSTTAGVVDVCGVTLTGVLDLRDATAGSWRDDGSTCPRALAGRLVLDGFAYGRLEDHPVGLGRSARLPGGLARLLRVPLYAGRFEERLEWLARNPGTYAPRPYDQLAQVCGRAGQDNQARVAMIARQRRRRGHDAPAPGPREDVRRTRTFSRSAAVSAATGSVASAA